MKKTIHLVFGLNLTCFIILSSLNLSGQAQLMSWPDLTGPYIGQTPPGTTPEKFAPNLISTSAHEFSCSFTPDGMEFYFTRKVASLNKNVVMVTSRKEGFWSKPEVAPFIQNRMSFEPIVTAKGDRIYFSMVSPEAYGGNPCTWYVERAGDSWTDPLVASDLFNPMKTMFVSVDLNGILYTMDITRGQGSERICNSTPDNGIYTRFTVLPEPINSGPSNTYPFISPDGTMLIFNSSRNGATNSVLFVSHQTADGSWEEPVELDLGISAGLPYLSYDGKYLFFTSGPNTSSDLYWVSAEILESGSSSVSDNPLPCKVQLEQNYPNPCQYQTRIPIILDRPGKIELSLFSATGIKVFGSNRELMAPGTHEFPIDVSNLKNGFYIYSLICDGVIVDQKTMEVLR